MLPRWLRLCAAALVLAAAGCAERPPSVVLVLVDQLRKDAADRYMDGVNELARRGVVVEEMRAAAPWTYPSVISLMSGLYPQQHGAYGHPHEDLLSRFDPAVPLLQARLRREGWHTAAFVTNPFLLDWNAFHEGFDFFDDEFVRSQGPTRGHEGVWIPERMFSNSVNDAVRSYYDARPLSSPEFTYIHYIDVHGPWTRAPFRRRYQDAVRYTDRKIVEIYGYLLDRYEGDVLFIVTSDHGRALADDRRVGDGARWRLQKQSVHDYNLRIPFAILPSRRVTAPRHVHGPASNVDVTPTLLAWLGLPPEVPLAGRSLLPAIRGGGPLPADRPVYAVNSAFGARNDGVVWSGRKFVRFFDVDSGEVLRRRVFDPVADPREIRPLEVSFDEAEDVLREASGDHGVSFASHFDDVSPELREQLEALGYLKGTSAP